MEMVDVEPQSGAKRADKTTSANAAMVISTNGAKRMGFIRH